MLNVGDIIGFEGELFIIYIEELILRVKSIVFLIKNVRFFFEKYYGFIDVEIRYRKRYVDLIMNLEVREIFIKRIKIIKVIRKYLDDRGFLEVEIFIMYLILGGVVVKFFIIYYNILNIDLFLRIVFELYLKKLIVGGFERVYDLNRNFRNEGIFIRYNFEFIMVELY